MGLDNALFGHQCHLCGNPPTMTPFYTKSEGKESRTAPRKESTKLAIAVQHFSRNGV